MNKMMRFVVCVDIQSKMGKMQRDSSTKNAIISPTQKYTDE